MNPNKNYNSIAFEKRWPVGLTVIIVGVLVWLIPERISILPSWTALVSCIILLIPLTAVGLTKANPFWLKIEKITLSVFLIIAGIGNLINLTNLVGDMINKSTETSGFQLLTSSITVWIVNILAFSLLYWQIDRKGPEARQNNSEKDADWIFPQESAPEIFVTKNWRPVYIDYLYLGYSTSTAFSTTDVIPITSKAKLLMMIQSTISLTVIVVVGARAINILGS